MDEAEPPPPMVDDERLLLAQVLGGKAGRYLAVYDRRRVSGRRWLAGWSWPALLLGPLWAYYRRLYGIALAGLAAGAITITAGSRVVGVTPPAVICLALAVTLTEHLVLALLGPGLVVDGALARLRRLGEEAGTAARSGPLRRYAQFTLANVGLGVLAGIVLAVALKAGLALPRPLPGMLPPAGGLAAVSLPAAMLLANASALVLVAWGCRRLVRTGGWWPPLAAVAAGWSAVALAALPVGTVGAALLPSTPGPRLYGATYLLIGPWEEAAKLAALVLLLLPTEPVRRPRDGLVAALLLGAGFGMAENLVYVGAAPEPFMLALLRALVPGHLIVAPFAALGLHAALQRRERALSIWPCLALGWLAAALAHGAFDHGALVLASYMAPPEVKEDTVLHALGLTPAGVRGLPLGPTLAAALLLAACTAAAVATIARLLRDRPAPVALPVLEAGA